VNDIEGVITRIRSLRAFGLGVAEIRECISPAPEEVGVFYLCFIAAQIAEKPLTDTEAS